MGILGFSSSCLAGFVVVLCLVWNVAVLCNGGKTRSFVRNVEKTIEMPLDSDVFRVPPGYNAPQQVHIIQGDHVGKVIVSWVTEDEAGSNTVVYWSATSKEKKQAEGKLFTYKFYNYTSGYIHYCTIRNLEFNTTYYYMVGIGHTERTFWFITPPESFDSNKTITHYEMNPQKGQTVLFVWDLPYADKYLNHDNVRWDAWGRFVERSVAYQPWKWTAGNDEIDLPLNFMTEPQPAYSAYREASFGHVIFDIKNKTHAQCSWHRNQDGSAVDADSMWFFNRYWHQINDSTTAES